MLHVTKKKKNPTKTNPKQPKTPNQTKEYQQTPKAFSSVLMELSWFPLSLPIAQPCGCILKFCSEYQ